MIDGPPSRLEQFVRGLFTRPKVETFSTVSRVSAVSLSPETNAEHEAVVSALKRAKRPVSNDDLARLMAVSKGESSKRVAALNGRVRKVRAGRQVQISLLH